jgi:hypothetical protein
MDPREPDDASLRRLESAWERADQLASASSPGSIQYELATRLRDHVREEIAAHHAHKAKEQARMRALTGHKRADVN